MKIISTLPGDAHFKLFEGLTKLIYSDDVIHLKSTEKVPEMYLKQCFVLVENDIPLARVSVYLNPLLEFEGKKTACIGNYECVDDDTVAQTILNHAKEYCKKLGAEIILGPMNGSTWENYRFSLEHNHPNFFLEPYHHLYYNEQFKASGYQTIGDYHSLLDTEVEFKILGAAEKCEMFKNLGVTFRQVDLANFETDLAAIYDLNEIAFASNFLYTPIEKADFINKYAASKQIIQAEFMLLAFDPNQKLMGYYFCVPDLYNSSEKSLIIKSIARNPDPKWRGLGYAIGNQIYQKAKEFGFQSVIHAFMYNEGTSSPLSEHFSDNSYKNYRLYGQAI